MKILKDLTLKSNAWKLNRIEVAIFLSILKIKKNTTFFVGNYSEQILVFKLKIEQFFKILPVKSSAQKLNEIEIALFLVGV